MEPRADLADRLAALPSLSEIPEDELAWLLDHGEAQLYPAGEKIVRKGEPVHHLWILLAGRVAVTRDTGAGPKPVLEWGPGDVTGVLPFSRMQASTVDIPVHEPLEVFTLHRRHFGELTCRCPRFTALTVHTMVDRARTFNTTALHTEKMVSLGRLAAGLAHELNNPASATVRGAAALRRGLADAESAARALFRSGLTDDQFARIEEFRTRCMAGSAGGVLSALELADREAELEEWLDRHGSDIRHAAALAETSVTTEALSDLASGLPAGALDGAVGWLSASCATGAIAAGIEGAARRIHELVGAVKGFTHMDNLGEAGPVDVADGIRDTVTVLSAKARGRGASVRLDLPAGLPPVPGMGGELNQVWMNLVDNALSAVDDGGRVEIRARAEGDEVVVSVVDDGSGIPPDVLPRIFEPFFTTRPQGEGTGLGLDIARRLVRRRRGDIEVDSRPGRTEFRVRLKTGSPNDLPPESP